MSRSSLMLTFVIVMTACSPRGEIQFAAPVADATVQNIWVANFRQTLPPQEGQRVPPRPTGMSFQMNEVSIPPGHLPGAVEWPRSTPDASTDFVTLSEKTYPHIAGFASAVAAADTGRTGETVVFVHGYNRTHGEAVYQLAQVAHDFDIPSPTVLFSWPSSAMAAGYVYDRDSALYARDQLEELILALTRRPGRKVIIIGHSMGNFLIMETLRQIDLSGSLDIGSKIDALFMISPDIDGELFYTQASRLKVLPDPSVIVAAKQDRALRIAAILTGKTQRLGSLTDRSAVADLPISVIDVSDLGTGGLDHGIAMKSPAAISIFRRLAEDAAALAPHLVLSAVQ